MQRVVWRKGELDTGRIGFIQAKKERVSKSNAEGYLHEN